MHNWQFGILFQVQWLNLWILNLKALIYFKELIWEKIAYPDSTIKRYEASIYTK